MEYFKAVSVVNGKFFSYNLSTDDNYNRKKVEQGVVLEYKIGEWTRPKIEHSSLFCLSSLEDAKILADDEDSENLAFRCEVINPSSKGYWTGLTFDMDRFLQLVEEQDKENDISNHIIFSKTVFCDAIKLVELIK